ncbi:hypothetical protein McpCs1_14860 [Methanocorpusculaceae archaeon Cs1]|uniref:Uncharacterized protein n=1 Tax=Methanorbis rubei TaxID=3028300 RepID=A0AAE4MHA2_9EURY|nr:hypothetical protein [Methanocorpusculaceae archaeon Cs1]
MTPPTHFCKTCNAWNPSKSKKIKPGICKKNLSEKHCLMTTHDYSCELWEEKQ